MTATTYTHGTIVEVPPAELLLDRNIRIGRADADLIKSIRDAGVLQPVVVVLTPENQLRVRFGQRRTLAAIEAKRATIPVYITGDENTDDSSEIDRIVAQRDENTHRHGLTAGDEVAIVEQLAAFGLSAAQITKKARIKRANVDAALTVAESDLARKATDRYESLTLDQAAVVADFETDTDTVKALIAASATGQFAHVAQRARDARDEAAAKQTAAEAAEAEGLRLIARPDYRSPALAMSRLRNTDGTILEATEHNTCPGRVGWLTEEWACVDAEGNVVDDDADLTEEEEEALTRVQIWSPTLGCENAKKHGHRDSWATNSGSTKPKAEDMTEAERAAAKAQRTLVIENNKAWDSAETVRREWVAAYLTRKTAPKGIGPFLAVALATDPETISSVNGSQLAAEWFGTPTGGYGRSEQLRTLAAAASESRALVIALGQVLAGYEANLTRASWRGNGTQTAPGRYLRFLETSGYTLSDVEQYATSAKTT